MTFRPPKDAKEGRLHYESAIRIAEQMKADDPARDPALPADPVLKAEAAALHALTFVDPDGLDIGPDYNLVEQCADLARRGFDVVDGEIVRVRKTRLDPERTKKDDIRIGPEKPKRVRRGKAQPRKSSSTSA